MGKCTVSADSATDKWDQLQEAICTTALTTFGKRISKSSDWFKVKSSMITPVNVAMQNSCRVQMITKSEEFSGPENLKKKQSSTYHQMLCQ